VSKTPPSEQPADEGSMSFEEALTRLERIVSDLEGGRYTLEESLQKFEEGIALGNRCRRLLERADVRVRTLLEAGERLVVSDADDAEHSDGPRDDV
jgi:exodeoxyribonuclease VII small subunit